MLCLSLVYNAHNNLSVRLVPLHVLCSRIGVNLHAQQTLVSV